MGYAVLLLLCSSIGFADEPVEIVLPSRTTLAVQLDKSVKAGHAHPGDPVVATLVAPVLWHGAVVIPKSAKVWGHVLASQPRRNDTSSRLVLRFEQARWHGQSARVNAYILRQLVPRRTVRTVAAIDSGCSSMLNGARISRQNDDPINSEVRRRPGTASTPRAPCVDVGAKPDGSGQIMVFFSPPLKNMRVRWAPDSPGVTELFSEKKTVSLHRGTILELQHVSP